VIPLLPGATHVNVRPYHYPPAVKDKIERQVMEMLRTGVIQPNSSLFASSVLLVIYLGIPISYIKVTKGQLNVVCIKTEKRLGTWQGDRLSLGAKSILISSCYFKFNSALNDFLLTMQIYTNSAWQF